MSKTAYVILGINLDGRKDVCGIRIGENKSSKFWISVLNDLKIYHFHTIFKQIFKVKNIRFS